MNKKELSLEARNKLAYIAAVITVIFAIASGVMIYVRSANAYPLILGVGALIYGPLCLAFYIYEMARGVLKGDEGSETITEESEEQ